MDRTIVLLSSLLHDIGKVKEKIDNTNHAEYGSEFCINLPTNMPIDEISEIIKNHHNDSYNGQLSDMLKVVKISDNLSMRESNTIPDRLLSPLADAYMPIEKLDLNVDKFIPEGNSSNSAYESILDGLKSDIKILKMIDNKRCYIESLLYLLKKWLFTIPSDSSNPKVSLYDHLKLSMAIADCLHKDKEQKFVLVYGDITGIQRFIYKISQGNVIKTLRARNFYISAILNLITSYIIRELDLTSANIISSGGGHFLILAPSYKLKEIERCKEEIEEFLIYKFKGEVYITIAYKEIDGNDLSDIYNALKELEDYSIDRKMMQFSDKLSKHYDTIFGPIKKKADVCKICFDEIDKEGDRCELCKGFEEMAKPLGLANYIVEVHASNDCYDEFNRKIDKAFVGPLNFIDRLGICYILVENKETLYDLKDTFNLHKQEIKRISIFNVNNLDYNDFNDIIKEFVDDLLPISVGYKLFCNITPFNASHDIETLDDIADSSKGDKLIGVLRMDVDNLGKFFKDNISLAEYSTRDSLISIFFNGFMNFIADKEHVYVIYSGGDDLFIIGPWYTLLELAYYIHNKFARFSNNKKSLSAGYILSHPHTPSYILAYLARDAIDKAKEEGKDRICMFANDIKPIKWSTYVEQLKLAKDLITAIEDNKLSRSALFAILKEWYRYNRDVNSSIGALRYRIKYILSSAKISNPHSKTILEELDRRFSTNYIFLGLPLKFAELATRV